jgi:hypothetical protein
MACHRDSITFIFICGSIVSVKKEMISDFRQICKFLTRRLLKERFLENSLYMYVRVASFLAFGRILPIFSIRDFSV